MSTAAIAFFFVVNIMAAVYQYTVTELDLEKLYNLVLTTFDTDIEISVDFLNIKITFLTKTLTSSEKASLDNIVANHTTIQVPQNTVTSTKWITDNRTVATTSSTYKTKCILDADYLPAGSYKIEWNYAYDDSDGLVDIIIELDNSKTLNRMYYIMPIRRYTNKVFNTGFTVVEFTTGATHQVALKYRGDNLRGTTVLESTLVLSKYIT